MYQHQCCRHTYLLILRIEMLTRFTLVFTNKEAAHVIGAVIMVTPAKYYSVNNKKSHCHSVNYGFALSLDMLYHLIFRMFLCTGWTSRPLTMLSCTMAQGSSASSSSKSKSIMSPKIQKLSLKQNKQRCFTRKPSFIIQVSIWASRHPSAHNIVRAVLDRPEYCVVACVQHRDHPGNLMIYIHFGNLKRFMKYILAT